MRYQVVDQVTTRQIGIHPNNGFKASRFDPKVHAVFGSLKLMGTATTFQKGREIYGQNEPAEYVYKLLKGTAQSSKILSDGRRQIQDFYFPGDVFGMASGLTHEAAAEAVTDVTVAIVNSTAVATTAAHDSEVASHLLAYLALELDHARNHSTLLVKTAQERVASFLLQLNRRFAGNTLQLTMSRLDIADYLGLTVETVSRTFTQFENAGTIRLAGARTVVLCDRNVLEDLNE
jgi:CRP/FNR family nitrogen fixation transcriptional regulator